MHSLMPETRQMQRSNRLSRLRGAIETFGPALLGAGLWFVSRSNSWGLAEHGNWPQLLSSTIDSAAIGAGFLATAAGSLYALSASKSEFVENLKKYGVLAKLIKFVWGSFFATLSAAAFSWFLLLRGGATDELVHVWLGIIGFTAARVVLASAMAISSLNAESTSA